MLVQVSSQYMCPKIFLYLILTLKHKSGKNRRHLFLKLHIYNIKKIDQKCLTCGLGGAVPFLPPLAPPPPPPRLGLVVEATEAPEPGVAPIKSGGPENKNKGT